MSNEKKYNLKHIGKKLKNTQGFDVEVIDGSNKKGYCIVKITPDNELEPYVCEKTIKNTLEGICPYPNKLYDALYLKKFGKVYKRYNRANIGETHKTTEGYNVEVIDGGSRNNYVTMYIKGEGLQEYITETPYDAVVKGQVKYPYHPSVCGIGYLGVGKHKPSIKRKNTKTYEKWNGMIHRCYNPKELIKHPTYKGVTVCSKWHNFQNFAEWYKDNYVDGYELDKDLLSLPNVHKRYCESTCIFIPHALNTFLTFIDSIGYHKLLSGRYQAVIGVNRVNMYLGVYDTPEEASKVYKEARAEEALKWKMKMVKEWKHHLESDDKLISGKYQRAIDNIR